LIGILRYCMYRQAKIRFLIPMLLKPEVQSSVYLLNMHHSVQYAENTICRHTRIVKDVLSWLSEHNTSVIPKTALTCLPGVSLKLYVRSSSTSVWTTYVILMSFTSGELKIADRLCTVAPKYSANWRSKNIQSDPALTEIHGDDPREHLLWHWRTYRCSFSKIS
jgi:hypothetical protein